MSVTTTVRWDPSGLNRRLLAAFSPSTSDAWHLAEASSPGEIPVFLKRTSSTSASLTTTNVGAVFEKGRQGGYPIRPKNKAIKFKVSGEFYRGSGFAGGPMQARPFLQPAAAAWARSLYQARARSALAFSR